ncbi:hypothetical protein GCM10009676_43450 [Prauserella halophila]|uniref:DUF998 domain-containing protein n=1 Tax=Prauserella halophila TaxID=185641 RepID=A0ABN1WLL3_9PSEU|nr:DUF998 domain-containing protein [Prauserella halophila]MCP2237785.1 Protein of unknown function (DUF998) [Prauserella halophila]
MPGSASHDKVHTADVARTRAWTVAAVAGLGWAIFTLIILHSVSSFDPLTDPLSRYAFTDRGNGMLEASLLSVAVGVIAVRGSILSAGLPVSRTTSTLVYATSTGLATAALFPATFSSDIDPVSGRIHQYASVVAFLGLPAIALSLLDAVRATPVLARLASTLTWLLRVALVSLGLFGVSYIADALAGIPVFAMVADTAPVGFTQRIVFVVDFFLLAVLLFAAARHARATASTPGPAPAAGTTAAGTTAAPVAMAAPAATAPATGAAATNAAATNAAATNAAPTAMTAPTFSTATASTTAPSTTAASTADSSISGSPVSGSPVSGSPVTASPRAVSPTTRPSSTEPSITEPRGNTGRTACHPAAHETSGRVVSHRRPHGSGVTDRQHDDRTDTGT